MGGLYYRMFTLLLLTLQCQSQDTVTVTTITFQGSTTAINCPIQQVLTIVYWTGPPKDILYYDPGSGRWSDKLGEKANRLSLASNQSLILTGTKLTDNANYSCATEIGGKIYNGVNKVEVRARAALPVITATAPVNDSFVFATEGESVTVYCTSRGGIPAPSAVLTKGPTGLAIPGTVATNLEADGTYTVTLTCTFSPTRQDDQQLLQCRSYWPEPPDGQDLQLTKSTLYLFLKPSLPTLTPTKPVVSGSDITVECKTSGGRPAANISWTFRGEILASVTTVTPDSSTQTSASVSIIQRRVTSADNGHTLTCKVSHVTGELMQDSTLNVQFAVPLSSTRITGNRIIEANGDNPLPLTCITGSSNPASDITWKKGNNVINSDSPYIEQPGDNQGTIRSQVLTLRPSRNDNGKTISCSVSNIVSQMDETTSITLVLHYSPFIKMLANQTVIEGDNFTLSCTASSKPTASFRWAKNSATVVQGNGTVIYNGLDYTITAVTRTQAGTYICTADNNIPPTDSKQTTLVVQYPPDIVVAASNTSVHSKSTTLTCGAYGVPDQYTYDRWVHTFNGKEVMHPESLPASRELTFHGLSYALSGVYRCGASNGVNEVVSHGDGRLLVQSFPVLIGNTANTGLIKASGQLMKSTVVTFQYYSNAGNGSVKVLKSNSSEKNVGKVDQRRVNVKLPVFLSEIMTEGTEVTINITITEESLFGEYQIIVTNELESVNLSLIIKPLGPPDTPTFVNSTVTDHHSVQIDWISGFSNGLNQTFVIQISTDNSTWRNITQYGGMSFQQAHSQNVENLASRQLYFVRILAVNGEGESQPTSIFRFETKAPYDTTTPSSKGLIAGGAAGGTVAALLVTAVIIFIVRRRRNTSRSRNAKDKGALVMSSNPTRGIDDDEEEVENPAYVSAGPPHIETTIAASSFKQHSSPDDGNIYAKVNKKLEGKLTTKTVPLKTENSDKDLYAVPDKLKGRKNKKEKKLKAKLQTGDVYENAPITMFGKKPTLQQGECINKNTSTTTAEAPRKPMGSDELLYADLEFGPKRKGPTKIIGKEDRCEYTTLDFAKKAQPLPDSDDEVKTKH